MIAIPQAQGQPKAEEKKILEKKPARKVLNRFFLEWDFYPDTLKNNIHSRVFWKCKHQRLASAVEIKENVIILVAFLILFYRTLLTVFLYSSPGGLQQQHNNKHTHTNANANL